MRWKRFSHQTNTQTQSIVDSSMAFSPNPLSLSVPEAAFESWLRDSGYIEVLDQRTSDLHRLNSSSTSTTAAASTSTAAAATITGRCVTFLSLLTLNPFAKLSADDFSAAQTPPWTSAFLASLDSYSFPSSPSQARLRVHENVKRYARNYATIFILVFASTLYKMPIALFGLIACLAIWDVFKFCSEKWGLAQYPFAQKCLVCLAQCVGVVILMLSNVQMALFCALAVSYGVVILHAALRKLTPTKQQPRGRRT